MSRKQSAVDRVAVLVVGLLLVLLALVVVDWRERIVYASWSESLRLGGLQDAMDSWWWPWLFAVVGVLLGLLGVWWILSHVGSRGPSKLRLSASAEDGRVEVDLRSLADAGARQLAAGAPVTGTKGTARTVGLTTLVELHGHVDPAADVEALTAAAADCSTQLAAAFPEDLVVCRVVLDAPQSTKPGRVDKVRVRQPSTTH